MSAPAIAATGLSKDSGSGRGRSGLDLGIERGEVFGFLGPNGAGKVGNSASISWIKYLAPPTTTPAATHSPTASTSSA